MTPQELTTLETWGGAVLKFAQIAQEAGPLLGQIADAKEALAQAKRVQADAEDACAKAQADHAAFTAQLQIDADAHRQRAMDTHAAAVREAQRDLLAVTDQVTAQRQVLAGERSEHELAVLALKQEREELQGVVDALKAYAAQAKEAVGKL